MTPEQFRKIALALPDTEEDRPIELIRCAIRRMNLTARDT